MTLQNPGVRFPPPLIFLGGFAFGLGLHNWFRPASITGVASVARTLEVGGTIVTGAGFALMLWGVLTFARAHTAIIPHKAASTLVQAGPYRFTRNPMYTGLTFAYIGGSLTMNTWWTLLFLPMVIALLLRFVVHREEAYLTDAFGDEYRTYQRRVRRFL